MPHHVVAATVEREDRRLQRERRLQLFPHDRFDQLAADGEVGVLDRYALADSEACGHEIGPAADRTVGELVADTFRKAVSDGY